MNRKIRTWVEISLNDLEHNYREISSRLPDGCQMLGAARPMPTATARCAWRSGCSGRAASGWPSTAMTRPRSCAPPV